MIAQILIANLIGVVLGILTGIIPGLHVNLLSLILLGIAGYLLSIASPIAISVFIVSIAVTHTFVNIIPSIFLGVPDESNSLAILPAHKMLLEGHGYEAVKLTVIGSLFTLIAVILSIPLLIPLLPVVYNAVEPLIGWMLVIISIFMILRHETLNKKFWGFCTFILSGILGVIALTAPSVRQPLLPMLSGLFGISVMSISLNNKVSLPKQKSNETDVPKKETVKAVSAAALSGSFIGIFPALGSSQAAILAMEFVGDLGTHAYLIMIGGINTANFVFSLATLYALNKARNGAVVALSELIKPDVYSLIILLCTALIAGAFATILTLMIGKLFSRVASKINYRLMILIVCSIIVTLTVILSSWQGILVLIVATSIGIIPALTGVRRSMAMGCLMLPVIIYYIY